MYVLIVQFFKTILLQCANRIQINLNQVMKRSLFFLVIFLPFYDGFTQSLKLKVNSIAPRSGDQLNISVTLEEDSTVNGSKDYSLFQCSQFPSMSDNPIGGEFRINKYLVNSGYLMIGPIDIKIQNKLFVSDSIRVFVGEKLPDIPNGIWFRIVEQDLVNYLIIEERIEKGRRKLLQTDTLYYGDSRIEGRSQMKMTGSEFTALNYSQNKVPGLHFSYQYYTSELQRIGKDENTIEVTYQKTVYKIEKDKSFINKFILGRDYFKNLPADYTLPLLIINPE